jgi:hypothetical protein
MRWAELAVVEAGRSRHTDQQNTDWILGRYLAE